MDQRGLSSEQLQSLTPIIHCSWARVNVQERLVFHFIALTLLLVDDPYRLIIELRLQLFGLIFLFVYVR